MAIYKRGRGFELWATEKQIQEFEVVRAGLEPGTAGLPVGHADTRTRCLPMHTRTAVEQKRVR